MTERVFNSAGGMIAFRDGDYVRDIQLSPISHVDMHSTTQPIVLRGLARQDFAIFAYMLSPSGVRYESYLVADRVNIGHIALQSDLVLSDPERYCTDYMVVLLQQLETLDSLEQFNLPALIEYLRKAT